MKLPKGFGGQGFSGMMRDMQGAMARAQNLESELAEERHTIDKGPVQAIFNGLGGMISIKIDKAIIDPDDLEPLEDLIVSVCREGMEKGTERRNNKLQEIMPNLPNIPGL